MKILGMIAIAAALCVPALASAQRGGQAGGTAVQRADVGRTATIGRAIDVRGGTLRGDIVTGTRIRPRPERPDRDRAHNPRRRWYNATHNPQRRRWYNANHPTRPDPSRRRGR
ncbi:MAG: hypothetical protein ACT4N8_07205 [Sphingosinicella sp.]|uniref:hypothetical protein n=1 Tax=Sphingosinicella sp. TaxID=1917971 RepID=UPI00403819D9